MKTRLIQKVAGPWRDPSMAVLAFLNGAGWTRFGEKLPVNGGLGWDGQLYASLAADPIGYLTSHGIDGYHLGRILPSGLVHLLLRAFAAEAAIDPPLLISAFGWLNVALLTATAVLFARITWRLKWSPQASWLGFCFLFINYGMGRHVFYSPLNVDVSAIFLCALSLHAFLSGRRWLLALATVAGAFCWPTVLLENLFLLLFPFPPASRTAKTAPRAPSTRAGNLFGAGAASVFLAGVFLAIRTLPAGVFLENGAEYITWPQFPISLAIAALYVFIGARGFYPSLHAVFWKDARKSARQLAGTLPLAFGTAAFVFILKKWALSSFPGPAASEPARTALEYLGICLIQSVLKPGIFLVAHSVYFGPLMIALMIRWRSFCDAIRRFGPGMLPVLCFLAILSLNSESRELTYGLPFIVAVLCEGLSRTALPPPAFATIAALSLLSTKFWLVINRAEFSGPLTDFPFQNIFMNFGPWMGAWAYEAQAVATVAGALLLMITARARTSSRSA